ncbi:MAG TPA: isoprenylcysteine carboxylmethyltransferase family protein [Candidatus Paceibacterota bacterium]|nr:isoprenylcysteine carboxylmethyltransferase family protein [Candidatus Paceibacterota bacterium]
MSNAKARALRSAIVSTLLVALALFLSAGTIYYWQAWVYLGILVITVIPLMRLIINDPVLVESRTKGGPAKEQRSIQKIIILVVTLPGAALFILPGLDHRFGWSAMPLWLMIVGDAMVAVSMWMTYRVFKENSFGSATVEVVKDQKVIMTGPYATVRNPMYSSASVYMVGMAFALGSYWTLIPAVLTILGLVWRLFDEEKFLKQNLAGYTEYCTKVRWHLLPGVF